MMPSTDWMTALLLPLAPCKSMLLLTTSSRSEEPILYSGGQYQYSDISSVPSSVSIASQLESEAKVCSPDIILLGINPLECELASALRLID